MCRVFTSLDGLEPVATLAEVVYDDPDVAWESVLVAIHRVVIDHDVVEASSEGPLLGCLPEYGSDHPVFFQPEPYEPVLALVSPSFGF